jgi:hypothetical protein
MRANTGIAWGYAEKMLVVVHAPVEPATADWNEFMDEVRTHSNIRGVMILANNSRLTPLQRAEIKGWYEEHKVRGALVTDSMMMRGIVTAMNWFGIEAKAFASDGLDAAMQYIGVSPGNRANLLMLVRKLEGMLPKAVPLAAH